MRVSVGSIADLAAREEGGILVFVAMLTPIVLLFLALIGRHRQLVGAQAAPAAPGRRGGPRRRRAPGRVLHRPGGREHGDHRTRRRDSAAARARPTTSSSAATNKGAVALAVPEQDVPVGRGRSERRHGDRSAPCDTANLMLDVKASEVGVPLLLRPLLELVAPGSAFADPTINTHARVRAEAGRDPGRDAARRRPRSPLQLRLRDLRQRGERRRRSARCSWRRRARAARTSSGTRRLRSR